MWKLINGAVIVRALFVVCTENGLLGVCKREQKEKIVLSLFSSPTSKFQSKLTLLARDNHVALLESVSAATERPWLALCADPIFFALALKISSRWVARK